MGAILQFMSKHGMGCQTPGKGDWCDQGIQKMMQNPGRLGLSASSPPELFQQHLRRTYRYDCMPACPVTSTKTTSTTSTSTTTTSTTSTTSTSLTSVTTTTTAPLPFMLGSQAPVILGTTLLLVTVVTGTLACRHMLHLKAEAVSSTA